MSKDAIQFSKLDIVLRKFAYFLFFVFVFFPFISFVDLGTDMQPYSFVIALILFFSFKRITFSYVQIYLFFIFLSSVLVFLGSGINFLSARSLFNYAQLFFVSYVGFQVLKSQRINFELFLKSSIVIWLLIGLIQTIYDKAFLSFLIRDPRLLSDKRGVTSLAAEPTFYGIVLLFFILFLFHTNYKHKNYLICSCVFGIIFLAKSSMVFLFLAIMIFFYLLTHLGIRSILYTAVFFLIVPFFILEFMQGTRISYLIYEVLYRPSFLTMDFSITDRLFHVFFSLKGFLDNFMLPNGFLSWESYMSTQIQEYTAAGTIPSDYEQARARARGGRIMSGYGAAFFELGIISVLIPITLLRLYYSLYKNNLKKFFFFSLFVNSIMFAGISIGFSMFAFYIGFLLYLLWQKSRGDAYYT